MVLKLNRLIYLSKPSFHMAQPTGQNGGKAHSGLRRFGPVRSQSNQCYGSFGLTDFKGEWWPNTVSTREIFSKPARLQQLKLRLSRRR